MASCDRPYNPCPWCGTDPCHLGCPLLFDDEPDFVRKWNAGKIAMGVAHPASMAHGLNLQPVIFDSVQATRQAFFSGRCDALISDASALASAMVATW